MGKIWRGILFCMLLCGVMTTASGCGGLNFTLNPQELYSLPKLPSKYDALNTLLGEIIGGGAEYASPTSGTNIQVVQMMDLVKVALGFVLVKKRMWVKNLVKD